MYILDFCSRKNTSKKSRNYRFRKASLLKCFLLTTFSNSPGLKSVFQKLRFRDGLVWTAGVTVEIEL